MLLARRASVVGVGGVMVVVRQCCGCHCGCCGCHCSFRGWRCVVGCRLPLCVVVGGGRVVAVASVVAADVVVGVVALAVCVALVVGVIVDAG